MKPQFWQVTARVPPTRVQRRTMRRRSWQMTQAARLGQRGAAPVAQVAGAAHAAAKAHAERVGRFAANDAGARVGGR